MASSTVEPGRSFRRAVAAARACVAAARSIESLALAAGAAVLAAGLLAVLRSDGAWAFPLAVAAGVIAARLRGMGASRGEAARSLDRNRGTGEEAASALVASPAHAVGRLCLARADARFAVRDAAALAAPRPAVLAVAGIAACAGLALLSIPWSGRPPSPAEDLETIESFARSAAAGGEGSARVLAERAAEARLSLATPGADAARLAPSIARIAREAEDLSHGGASPGSDAAGRQARVRAAVSRLSALAASAGEGARGTGASADTTGPETPASSEAAASVEPAGPTTAGPFSGVEVPSRYREVVARYFARPR